MRRTTSTDYDPWRDAAERYPAVHIEWHPIAPAHAAWVSDEGVILVDDSIDDVERRFALAHEIAHIDVGDHATGLCWFRNRQESAADRVAARRLIDAYALAEVMTWTSDLRIAAVELAVPTRVLRVRLDWLSPPERGVLWRAMRTKEAVA